MIGFVYLLFSVLLNLFVLQGLRQHFSSIPQVIVVIMFGYVFSAGIFTLLARKEATPTPVSGKKAIYPSLLWALSLVCIFVAFFHARSEITLSQLIVIQSIAPLLAIFLTREVERSDWKRHLRQAAPLGTLLGIAWFEWRAPSWSGVPILVGVAISYVIAQTASRIVSRSQSALRTLARMNGSVAFFSLIWLLLICGDWTELRARLLVLIALAAAFGFALTAIQLTFVLGIRATRPVLSALALSAGVPFSVLVVAYTDGRVNQASNILAVIYCAWVTFQAGSKKTSLK